MHASQKEELVRLTFEYGGEWGMNHTNRLLRLIEAIDRGLTYDKDVVWVAAHMHDWGGYSPWKQEGVDHAVRSRQVADDFLASKGYPEEFIQKVGECIETHHQGSPERNIEAILLSDADALDFLGVIGILRDFAKKPKALREAYDTTQKRKKNLPGILCLEASRELAGPRVSEMEEFLARFEEETFGCF